MAGMDGVQGNRNSQPVQGQQDGRQGVTTPTATPRQGAENIYAAVPTPTAGAGNSTSGSRPDVSSGGASKADPATNKNMEQAFAASGAQSPAASAAQARGQLDQATSDLKAAKTEDTQRGPYDRGLEAYKNTDAGRKLPADQQQAGYDKHLKDQGVAGGTVDAMSWWHNNPGATREELLNRP